MILWTESSDPWGWPEEPACEHLTGWRLVAVWAAAFAASWGLVAAVVYGLVKLAGVL